MPADFARVKELFLAATELPAAERNAYLDRACGDDAALRRRIEAMLHSHEDSGELLSRTPGALLAEGAVTEAEGTAGGSDPPAVAALPGGPGGDGLQDLAFLAASATPEHLGRLGPYEVQEVVGRGGFGTVLKAFDERLHRVVAIKVLAPAYAAVASARKRFVREARAAAAVKDEHVVAIHDIHEDAQPPYLVMEFIAGVSLQDKIDRHGTLSVPEVLRVGMQIAEGLAAAHRQGLVHRDIKPANILLENGVERVKLTDFGLARAVDDASLTQSGTVAGTPMYMSPEQADGRAVDGRSDLFSLGSVLYALCTGHPPFRAAGTHAVLKRVTEASPRPVREVNADVPDWLAAIIAKLHAKSPEERFQSAREVADLLGQRLADVQAGRAVPAEPRGAAEMAEPRAARARTAGRWKPGVAGAALWLGGGLAVALVLLAVAVANQWGHDDADRGPDGRPDGRPDGAPAVAPGRAAPPPAIVPFDADQARQSQDAWAAHLGVPVETAGVTGMAMVLIPPGEFFMGSSQAQADQMAAEIKAEGMPPIWIAGLKWEYPRQRVRLTRPFRVSRHEVTVAQFRQFVEATGYRTDAEKGGTGGRVHGPGGEIKDDPTTSWRRPDAWPNDDHYPVLQVSWNDACAFCRWLSQKDGRAYRLPTEAEWEFACRAGSAGRYSFGDDPFRQAQYAVFFANHPEKVGARKPNGFGLRDMEGNAWEWCADWMSERYGTEPVTDPRGPDQGTKRVIRGGSYNGFALASRCAIRWGYPPDWRDTGLGFRVAVDEPPAGAAPPPAPPPGPAEKEKWVQLFDGERFGGKAGWKVIGSQPGNWFVSDGRMIGTGGPKPIFTFDRTYADFHLRVEGDISVGADVGIFFRLDNPAPSFFHDYFHGYGVRITAPDVKGKPGTIFAGLKAPVHNGKDVRLEPGETFTVEVIAKGNRLVVKVNGETTADVTDPDNAHRAGYFGVRLFNTSTLLRVRRFEVMDLSVTAAETPAGAAK